MKFIPYFFVLFSTFVYSQQTAIVDFQRIKADIIPNKFTKTIDGGIEVSFLMIEDANEVYLDAVDMQVRPVITEKIKVSSRDNKIYLQGNFKKGKTYTLHFSYTATPKQTVYFTQDQFWTQGQGKYTSHWLPSIDDMNDKIEFDMTYRIKHIPAIVSNGKLDSFSEDPFGTKTYVYNMRQPMASYLVSFAAGNFDKQEIVSASGIPIELYVSKKDTANFEPTYRHTKKIFDFLETEIGVPYPWQNYKQVPVRDFLYAGMENTGCTIFSEAFVVDNIGFNDRNYVNVNAHELAHQWFGNLITETSGTHHWLQEGFATYYALLAEREIFGEDYYYWKLYNSAEQLGGLSEEGKGQSLLDPKASSLTFYEKGAWALHILKELIGEQAFKSAIYNYLIKHGFKNVETEDFLREVRTVSAVDISVWEKDWLQQTAFKSEQAYQSLIKSSFMQSYFELASKLPLEISEKREDLMTAINSGNDYLSQEAVRQLAQEEMPAAIPFYKEILKGDNLLARQGVAFSVQQVPISLQSDFETLLDDASYTTQEAALFALWGNFPEERTRYLDKMDGVIGFQNKNIRQAWLIMAIFDKWYRPPLKEQYKTELIDYTSPAYSFEIRQKAFEYCTRYGIFSQDVLFNLIEASVHHNWRFRNQSRKYLDTYLEDAQLKELIEKKMPNLSAKEQQYLQKKFSD